MRSNIRFEDMYMASEEEYKNNYSHGEYCHEQSFKWGYQEGVDYCEFEILNQVFEYIRDTYISAISDTDECTDQMLERFSERFKLEDLLKKYKLKKIKRNNRKK